ncbi:MBL fold metallo-hydrolase [Tabrizicola sp.]|uniref:MBL fold metallo-hydrolase n=1 Tax=Tabrizicola sp. TaxID=2005166 RepID=UPI003F2CD1C8
MTRELKLQVLGCAGGYPYDGVACSGYLVSAGGAGVLFDCGPGVAARLLARMRAVDLEAVVISHLHPDHILDLIPLAYAAMTEWISRGHVRRLSVFLPLGGLAFLTRLAGLFDHRSWRLDGDGQGEGLTRLRNALAEGRDWVFEVFDVNEFTAGEAFVAGSLLIDTCVADHTTEAACLATGPVGTRLVYTGDTRSFDGLVDFCRDADVLLCEAHFSGSQPPGGAHMTPEEAGDLARAAGARMLLLTHLAAAEDGSAAFAAASQRFGGPVGLALACLQAETVIQIGQA